MTLNLNLYIGNPFYYINSTWFPEKESVSFSQKFKIIEILGGGIK